MREKLKTSYTVETSYTLDFEPLFKLTNISHFTDAKDLYAVSLKVKEETTGSFTKKTTSTWSKVINKEHLEALIKEPFNYVDLEDLYRLPHSYALVTNEYIDNFVKFSGYGNQLTELADLPEFNVEKHVSSDFLNKIDDPKFKLIEYNYTRNTSHYLIDTEGNKYLQPRVLGYIGANLNNEKYDLDLLVEHLSKRDDITFILSDARSYSKDRIQILAAPFDENAPGIDKIITDIPHYNATEEQTESIEIIYRPKAQDVQKILDWEVDKSDRRDIWSIDDFIVKDILEGQQFCKQQPIPVEEPETPKRKFKK